MARQLPLQWIAGVEGVLTIAVLVLFGLSAHRGLQEVQARR